MQNIIITNQKKGHCISLYYQFGAPASICLFIYV